MTPSEYIDVYQRNPNNWYQGQPRIKRDSVVQNFTAWEIGEYMKCSADPAYFARNYLKVIHIDRGLVPLDLYPYQETMFKHFNEHRFTITLAARQSGKSVAVLAYVCWYMIFHANKNIAILANKGKTAQTLLSRVSLMLENLPFFLQPGCKSFNKTNIDLSNNSRVFSAATSSGSIRGESVSLLVLDEFAFVMQAADFYKSTYPVISGGKTSQVIVVSTANGIGNQFYKLWEGALQGTNEFNSFRVDWWDVPGRDEAWKIQTIANTSQLQFDVEYGNSFFGTGDTLIDANTLMGLRAEAPIKVMGDVLVYNEVEKNHDYVMVVDVAKGRNQDYSTFNVIDISVKPFKQVCVYRNNRISPVLFPNELYKWATAYNNAYVIIESNDQGALVCQGLYHELEYENVHAESVVTNKRLGVEMTKKTKRIGCSGFKTVLEAGGLHIVDAETIKEITSFEARGTSYEASDGNNDDLVMNFVMFGYFTGTKFFSNVTDINLRNMLYEQRIREIDDDVVPFGAIQNGLDEIDDELDPRENWSIIPADDWYNAQDNYVEIPGHKHGSGW